MKRIRIICDKTLTIMAVVLIVIFLGVPFFMAAITDSADRVRMAVIFGTLSAVGIIAILASSPRVFYWVTLTENGIYHQTLFHRKKYCAYKQYAYVNLGCYFHGSPSGVGVWVPYIVFSQQRIRTNDLYQINQFANDEKLFKVHYNKKVFKKLLEILPASHRNQVLAIANRIENERIFGKLTTR